MKSYKTNNAIIYLCFVTGKGPQKAHYVELLKHKSWKHVQVCTPWLDAEQYPKLLGEFVLVEYVHKFTNVKCCLQYHLWSRNGWDSGGRGKVNFVRTLPTTDTLWWSVNGGWQLSYGG